ncbi:MAG: aspartyl protease family protein [Ferruginibacter sp.]|nr:aspartyl protease family protein [Ferruginibacter sp.]
MRFITTILLLFFVPVSMQAQKPVRPDAKLITKFPFKMYSGGVMIIKAAYENIKDSFNFILDTGSGGISLDSSTCSEFNINLVQTDTSITGIAGTQKVSFAFNRSLNLPGLKLERMNFHVTDYNVLTSVYGEKIDGIMGFSFFSKYIVKINFDSMKVEIFSPGKIKYPNGGTTLHPIFTFLPVQYMSVKDKRKVDFNFYFDTGAGLCFLMSDQFAKDSSILLSKRKPVTTQAEGMGGKLQMRLTVVKEVKLGPYRFRQVPTYLYKDDFHVTSYPFTGGLVGNELLRRFNMIINYPDREIHLLPNNQFNETFEYGYTGFSIYFVNGKIMVDDVIKNSPADKAGFQLDDEIISVGTNFSNNIQQYKDLLQEPNVKIQVIIKRKGALNTLIINTGSIL